MNDGRIPATAGTMEINSHLNAAGLEPLEPERAAKFDAYLELILRWNARMNLTAVRDAAGIMRRHFVESIACARLLPAGIRSLLDFGSGAGFPGIPIALCRSEISVTLAESQARKAAFLEEAVRTLELKSRVWPKRGEEIGQTFGCVVLRAVDCMERAVANAAGLVEPEGRLGILTTHGDLPRMQLSAGASFQWSEPLDLPGSEQRILSIAVRGAS